jgi:NADPH-dependent curcumin reductase CurA
LLKLKTCYVIGIAGGADKCSYDVDELGFEQCIDYHATDFAQQLYNPYIKDIGVYFESVGSKVFDAVLPVIKHQSANSSLRHDCQL